MSTISPVSTATDSDIVGGVAEPTTATDEKKKSEPRPYVVLRQLVAAADSPSAAAATMPTWEFVAKIEATSAEQAIRKAAETPGTSFLNPDGPTTLVAVPQRSFNPVTVAVQTSTQIILS